MHLKVRMALTGRPSDGDIVDVAMTDGVIVTLVYDPHIPYDHYEWHVQAVETLEATKPLFEELAESGIEADWVAMYLSCTREVVIGEPLTLVLVPRGNMQNWPQTMTKSVVADISIRSSMTIRHS